MCSGYCLNGFCPGKNDKDEDELRCICNTGYSGKRCEIKDLECKRRCLNNSTCVSDPKTLELTCKCLPPFEGTSCDKCPGLQCGPGHCELDSIGRPRCVCPKGLSSPSCVEQKTCEGFQCFHNSTCHLESGQPECRCLDSMYSGRQCEFDKCLNGGVCVAVSSNVTSPEYVAECICDARFKGKYCQDQNKCYHHCLNGGTCFSDGDHVVCHCPVAYYGSRCNLHYGAAEDSGTGSHNVDNTAINSLTVTIVSVSIVSVALVAVLVYLLVFLLHRRRVTSPFKHRRMNDGSRPRSNNMEFANRMFLQDDDDVSDENGAFTMEELEPSTNFVNPVYETMFQDTQAPIIRPNADLTTFNNSVHLIPEQTGLLRSNEQAPPGRAVIHTDSD